MTTLRHVFRVNFGNFAYPPTGQETLIYEEKCNVIYFYNIRSIMETIRAGTLETEIFSSYLALAFIVLY